MKSMNPSDDVSIVIPVHNSSKFIVATLESVSLQSILPFEVIIVDDGSHDDTCSVIDLFSKANPQLNISLLRQTHLGPGSARNAGILAASGSWIAFLDSDDLWLPTKLEQVAIAHRLSPEVNFLCHNELHRRLNNSELVLDYSSGFNPLQSLPSQLYSKNRFSTSAVVCRRDLIVACGGFDITLPSAQDYELWLRMSPYLKVSFVPEVLGIYIDRVGNISSNKLWKRYRNILIIIHRHRSKVNTCDYLRKIFRLFASYIYFCFFRR